MLSSSQKSANGEEITINLDPPRINDNSNILIDAGLVDIEADNGVVHGIDSVLTPASISQNIVDIAAGNDAFTTLVAAVTAAGLGDALSGDGPLTVFGTFIWLIEMTRSYIHIICTHISNIIYVSSHHEYVNSPHQ